MRRKPHDLRVRGQVPGRAGKDWWSAPSHIAGGAGRYFDHALTEYGPGR